LATIALISAIFQQMTNALVTRRAVLLLVLATALPRLLAGTEGSGAPYPADALVLLGFLIFRWAVIAAPILGTIGLLRPASSGIRRLANAVVGSRAAIAPAPSSPPPLRALRRLINWFFIASLLQ